MNTNAEDTDSDNSNLRSDPELLEIINELSNETRKSMLILLKKIRILYMIKLMIS